MKNTLPDRLLVLHGSLLPDAPAPLQTFWDRGEGKVKILFDFPSFQVFILGKNYSLRKCSFEKGFRHLHPLIDFSCRSEKRKASENRRPWVQKFATVFFLFGAIGFFVGFVLLPPNLDDQRNTRSYVLFSSLFVILFSIGTNFFFKLSKDIQWKSRSQKDFA